MNDAYTLALPLGLTNSFDAATVMLLRDYGNTPKPQLDAQVASGDYFITLATALETIAIDPSKVSAASNRQLLIQLASDLDYLQRHYHIVSKDDC